MAPLKEANRGLDKGESGIFDDDFNKYSDIVELAQSEIINEIKAAIDQILFNKKVALLMYAKKQASKVIEADRLANVYGWREALSEDVTADEYKRYLGISNLEAYSPTPPEVVKKAQNEDSGLNKSKPKLSRKAHPSPPTLEELLNGAAKSFSLSVPEAPSTPSKLCQETESSQQKSQNEGFEKLNETSFEHRTSHSESHSAKDQKELLSPQTALENDQKGYTSLIPLLRKCYIGFVHLEVQNKKDEDLLKRVGPLRFAFLQFLKPYIGGDYNKDLYNKFSDAFSCLESPKELIFVLHLTSQLVVKIAGLSLNDQPSRSHLARALSLPVFAERQNFGRILYTHLFDKCPAILPLKNEALSSSEDSLKVFAFYCALLISENSKDLKTFFNLSAAWHWMVSLCHTSIDETSCLYLDIMLEICGQSLISTYKDQAIKLLRHLTMRTANLSHLAAQQIRIRILNLIANSNMPLERIN